MSTKFHCTNLSASWIVAVDGVYMECSDKAEAMRIYGLVNEISDSPFGSICVIAPNQLDRNIHGEVATTPIQTIAKRVNTDYIAKRIAREGRAKRTEWIPASARLASRREWDAVWASFLAA